MQLTSVVFGFDLLLGRVEPSVFNGQAPVVQTLDSAVHRINHYPVGSVIDFRNTYPLDSDLSVG